MIQTDIPVRMHDTGSPLVDAEGFAIGIVSLTLAKGLTTASAVSIDRAKERLMSENDGPLP